MQFGSTKREEELPEHVKEAKRVRDKAANMAGMNVELQLQSQRMLHLIERLNVLEGRVATHELQIKQMKDLHAQQLAALLGGGPTQ